VHAWGSQHKHDTHLDAHNHTRAIEQPNGTSTQRLVSTRPARFDKFNEFVRTRRAGSQGSNERGIEQRRHGHPRPSCHSVAETPRAIALLSPVSSVNRKPVGLQTPDRAGRIATPPPSGGLPPLTQCVCGSVKRRRQRLTPAPCRAPPGERERPRSKPEPARTGCTGAPTWTRPSGRAP
jgi:hypothetical protein